ncbi:MAG TPA: hypothetical protein VM674_03450, partial [Candidatus Acidoferrum sp.]|nr:hypothetical protein [Candidatus Acidoferrum sp.]
VYPFPNQPQDARIANPSLDERHELVSHNRVEVPHDVRFQDLAARGESRFIRDRMVLSHRASVHDPLTF